MKQEPKKEGISRRQMLQQSAIATAALTINSSLLRADDKEKTVANHEILASLRPEHPRLIASPSSWDIIKKQRAGDALLHRFLQRSEREARALFVAAPVTYEKQGRRLLAVSRRALRRVLLLSLHFHLTGEMAFAMRAKDEMLAAAAFADWNPSHFLDTAEMTAALAFGYDWLFHQLDGGTRQIIKAAIIEKGLQAGMKSDGWKNNTNNWNQVCLAGMSLGALAVAEDEPQLAAQTLQRTKDFNKYGLQPYKPEGIYPEGAMYWAYGTTFQTVLLSALQSALGTDWGLSQSPGFLQTGTALNQQLGPTGNYFNFSDNIESPGLEPAMWWFASTLKQPALLRYESKELQKYAALQKEPQTNTENNRLLPLAALWWPEKTTDAPQKLPLNWHGKGENSLVVFRSAWDDPQATFLALKGGKAALSHAHMDAGSFVFEAKGVRWACDLGLQDYYSLESKNIGLWDGKQEGERWKIFRLNNFSHNTLTINDQLHLVNGEAIIRDFSATEKSAIVDLSAVFAGQATKVVRRFQFSEAQVVIRDELQGLKPKADVRWAMLTRAEIALDGKQATLMQNGQKLRVTLQTEWPAQFETISADPPRDYDAPNPGFRFLIVHLQAPQNGNLDFSVTLAPSPLAS